MSLQYATEETPLGTAGSVKNAEAAAARRDVPGHLRRRAHRHRPHRPGRSSTSDKGALVTVGLTRVPDPLEFGIVIVDDDGRVQRFLEKPTWGQVFSDTVNTGIYVMEPEVFDYVAGRRVGRLVRRRVPHAARPRRCPSTATSPRATGRTSAPSRPTCRPRPTCSTGKVEVDIDGFEVSPGRLGRPRAPRSHPDAVLTRPAAHRRLRQGRGRRRAARVHRARQQRRREERRLPAPRRRPRQRLRRPADQPARLRRSARTPT